ncbi:MAG: acetylglutamate kinase [bacterium]
MENLLIVKIGGNVIDQGEALASFLDDFAHLATKKILVHGGGKLATEVSHALGIEAIMVEGRRITDQETLKVVTMVYGGWINKTLVSGLQARGCNALGLTGADADVVVAKKRQHPDIDFGFVGDIDRVNGAAIVHFLQAGLTPVFAPLTHDGQGTMLNTNADTIAAALARAMLPYFRTTLIYCFDKKGVLAAADEDAVIANLTFAQYQELRKKGVISKGMIPKLDESFAALAAGAEAIVLCHASQLRLVVHGDESVGTRLSVKTFN